MVHSEFFVPLTYLTVGAAAEDASDTSFAAAVDPCSVVMVSLDPAVKDYLDEGLAEFAYHPAEGQDFDWVGE